MNDYILRPFQQSDRPQLKTLWQIAFGDEEAYIERFFSLFLKPGSCVVADIDGTVVSAMYIIPGQSLYPYRKNVLTAGYTYALATLPEYRGRGIGTAVYKATVDIALQSADCACVLPAEKELYPFYEAAGAKPVSFMREARLKKAQLEDIAPGKAARVPSFQYAAMREGLLGGMPHAALPEDFFDLMESGGTDFFLLENGLATVDTQGDICRVTELLDPGADGMRSIAALAYWCTAEEYIVRTPVFFDGPGEVRPFMLAVMKEAPSYPMADDLWWGFGLE